MLIDVAVVFSLVCGGLAQRLPRLQLDLDMVAAFRHFDRVSAVGGGGGLVLGVGGQVGCRHLAADERRRSAAGADDARDGAAGFDSGRADERSGMAGGRRDEEGEQHERFDDSAHGKNYPTSVSARASRLDHKKAWNARMTRLWDEHGPTWGRSKLRPHAG